MGVSIFPLLVLRIHIKEMMDDESMSECSGTASSKGKE